MGEAAARIGPNAILQFVPVLEAARGPEETAHLLAMAGIITLPDPAKGLIEEGPAARLHRAVRQALPHDAARLARAAGLGTGDYILAHRIPRPAQAVLKRLPARLSVPILSKAIAKHAWTFCGSGAFRLVANWPPVFEIADNPVVRGEVSDVPLCHWHAAVFERLFTAICGPRWRAVETQCCAQGSIACRFELHRLP
ncbi:bacteriochlorophyll 4-vinyl reductase [Roseicyclus mahoneyensis]|uniref:Divinyl protochlorophyllide a 8-vinyl-reductase n=1 Tax=Roseicyclus mahoneyensis TaxID=164332 RepID=A0A316GK18_9RHOB|nr:bacteriochlorophyll 4-vinyl reductase [Roseicyclus mahoneyensis]PWK60966.1 divinyl protochlorophyllide a 8-vinyl-reductase [Roseicyclus mahoneyensis]